MLHAVDSHASTIIMEDKKTSLEVIKSEIKEEPQSSEEPYKTYIVKEEDLEDDWTENDAKEVSEEQQSSERTEKSQVKEDHLKEGQQGEEVQRRFHTDSVLEADSEDGWTEDDDAKETEAQQSKEADHQTLTYFIKEEPADSDSADDDDERTALQATSQSCSKQGGDSSLQSSYQSMRNSQEMSDDKSCDGARHLPEDFPLQDYLGTQSDSSERESCTSGDSSLQSSYQRNTQEMSGDRSCDGARHLPEDFPLQDYLGTQSDSSERESCTSENDSYLIPSQVPYFHEKRAADRETLDATTSSHKPEGMDIDRNEDITMEYDEMINQSSQLHATGSDQNDPSCRLTEEKRFLCRVCSKGFYFKSRLSRHMKIHGREKAPSKKPHQCMVCDLTFSRVDELSRHIRSHTGSYTGEMPYKCSFCQKSLSTSGHLSRHMKVHTGEKPYECSFCKKTFSQTHHLSTHIKIHTGERPFECSVCSKTFSERWYLTEHQKVHTGEKPYICSICEKRFTSNCYCKRHMRIHTGEKPFPCSICDKSFREKSTHTKHMTTHSGEKPHVCLICNKAFSQRRTLLRHKTIHTKETNLEKS
eukprot:XP_011671072.1 PREDICTED: zinc finger protein 345 isoform X2 [Strongylocentrotus purpuratus]